MTDSARELSEHDSGITALVETPPALRGFALLVATVAIVSANFMNVLDTTIATVAVPSISGGLAATPAQGTWIVTSYAASLAVVLPLSGWITRRFGEVRVFVLSLAAFTLMSLACAMVQSFETMVLFRALQGFSGGLLLPLSQTLVLRIYPREKHGIAMAAWALTSSIAPIVGPILGGWLTDNFGWPWIFYINIPVGLFCVYISIVMLRPYESAVQKDPVDVVGLVLLIVGVLCLQVALDQGEQYDWFESAQIRLLFGIFAVCAAAFFVWERYEAHPVIDFSLFGYRTFVSGALLYAAVYLAFMIPQVLYPIWIQTVVGYTATWAGLVMAPSMLPPLFIMPLIGRYIPLLDPRKLVAFGCMVFAYSILLNAWSAIQISPAYIINARMYQGVGLAFTMLPLMVLSMSTLPAEKYSSGTGIFNFMRMVASSMGTALAVSLWEQRAIFHHANLAEHIDSTQPLTLAMLDTLRENRVAEESIWAVFEQLIQEQALTMAMNDVTFVCVGMAAGTAVLVLLIPRGKRVAQGVAVVD